MYWDFFLTREDNLVTVYQFLPNNHYNIILLKNNRRIECNCIYVIITSEIYAYILIYIYREGRRSNTL